MYQFWYDYLKKKYKDKVKLCFTDTDSFLVEIEKAAGDDDDVYKDMIEDYDMFDFSDYPSDCEQFKGLSPERIHFLQEHNRKVLGKMKDETKSRPIRREVALRPKSYGIEIEGKVKDNVTVSKEVIEKTAGKGVKDSVRREHLTIDRHVEALALTAGCYALNHPYVLGDESLIQKIKEGKERKIIIKQNLIRSRKHELQTISMEKVGLSGFDIKRIVEPDNINTLPYGHVKYTPRNDDDEEHNILNEWEDWNVDDNDPIVVSPPPPPPPQPMEIDDDDGGWVTDDGDWSDDFLKEANDLMEVAEQLRDNNNNNNNTNYDIEDIMKNIVDDDIEIVGEFEPVTLDEFNSLNELIQSLQQTPTSPVDVEIECMKQHHTCNEGTHGPIILEKCYNNGEEEEEEDYNETLQRYIEELCQ
jgi:hypothetical protein